MKKFFIKLAAAVGCLGLVLVPISAYNKYDIDRRVNEALQLPDSISVIAVGHSHIECSLDPAYFPEMVNRARSGEGTYYSLPKSLFYVKSNTNLQTVIIPWSFFVNRGYLSFINETNYDPFRVYFPLFIQNDKVYDYFNSDNSIYFLKNYIPNKFGVPTKESINKAFHRGIGISTLEFEGGFISEFKATLDKDNLKEKVGAMSVNINQNHIETISVKRIDFN